MHFINTSKLFQIFLTILCCPGTKKWYVKKKMYLESEAYIKKILHFRLYKTLCDKKYMHSVEAKHERSLNLY